MTFKQTLFSAVLPVALVASSVQPTFIQARSLATVEDRMMLRDEKKAEIKTTMTANRIKLATTNADREIDRRVTALTALQTRISNMKRVSTEKKDALRSEIQTAITNLTALKAKIDADTDPAVLKTDKQSIVTSYRVFLFLMPKVEILAHSDQVLETVAKMNENNAKLQEKITAAQTAGKDVTAANAAYTDRVAKIADAQAKALSAVDTVTPLTVEGSPANKTTLMAAKDMLKVARQDLNTAAADARKIAGL